MEPEEKSTAKRDVSLITLALIATVVGGWMVWSLLNPAPGPVAAPTLPAPTVPSSPSELPHSVDRPDPQQGASETIAPLDSTQAADSDSTGVERSVRQGLTPWESQAVNVITGSLIGDTDFSDDMHLADQILGGIPAPWEPSPIVDDIPTPTGDTLSVLAENSQPFRALRLLHDTSRVADVWLFAGRSEAGLEYLQQARDRWSPDTTADHLGQSDELVVTPTEATDPTRTDVVWFASLSRNAVLLISAPPEVSRQEITRLLIEWRGSPAD